MSEFVTKLEVELVNEQSGVWVLSEPLVYQSAIAGGAIVVPKGTVTDFASVPRLPLVYWLCGDVGHAAAVIHDHLYQNGMLDRETCDKVFREALIVSGVSGWRVAIMYRGVRLFGGDYYQRGVKG